MQVVRDAQQQTPADACGESSSGDLVALAYQQLKRIAERQLAGERAGHTLQPTARVHEAFLRLTEREGGEPLTREQFFVAAADAMRKILVEHARSRGRQKRGGGRNRVPLDPALLATEIDGDDILALDELIQHLEREAPLAGSVVRLRFYAGLSVDEVASVLGVSASTVDRNWTTARAWLWRQWTSDQA